MSAEADLYRMIGELTATNKAILHRLQQIEAREEARDTKIDNVHRWMSQAQGSWKAMVAAGGAGAAITGLLIKGAALLGFGR